MKLIKEKPLQITVMVVIGLAAAALAGVYAGRGVLASEPSKGETALPTAMTIADVDPSPTNIPAPTITPILEAATGPSSTPAIEPSIESTTETAVHPKLPPLPEKRVQSTDTPKDGTTKDSRPELVSSEGTVYTYRDGDMAVRVVLQDDLVVQETAANTRDDVVVVKRGDDNIVRKQARHEQDARPVFRSESGGGLMTLPGGIFLVLDPEWDQTKVESFFSANDISADRVSDLGFLLNGFLVETEPGFASLELANALASKQGVVLSSPNWWREVEAR